MIAIAVFCSTHVFSFFFFHCNKYSLEKKHTTVFMSLERVPNQPDFKRERGKEGDQVAAEYSDGRKRQGAI
jgi:hypothetical protein